MADVYQRAPYGRQGGSGQNGHQRNGRHDGVGANLRPYRGETYYGRPSIKQSHYGWLVATYLFVGGLAGAAQVIATAAELAGRAGDRSVVRGGRYLALLGALISPLLLIKDLNTPSRWYNMLRIFRPTSPMSIGSWTLAAFGATSGLAALGQMMEDAGARETGRAWGRLFGLPAALFGMLMSVYTGSLLAATSVPFWASAERRLPALFGAASTSSASAAIGLLLALGGARRGAWRRLERLALVASAAELGLAISTMRQWKDGRVGTPLEQQPLGTIFRVGVLGLGAAAPLAIHALQVLGGLQSRALAVLAALATLVGGYVLRAALVFGGNASAQRPEDYFRFTQPAGAPAGGQGQTTSAMGGQR